jgi:hypothetical protein
VTVDGRPKRAAVAELRLGDALSVKPHTAVSSLAFGLCPMISITADRRRKPQPVGAKTLCAPREISTERGSWRPLV